jgi:hypothetical protein
VALLFFIVENSAATNYETKKNRIQRRQLSATERFNCTISKMRYYSIVDEHRCRMGLAMRVEKTPQYPYAITLGALPLTESHLVYQVGKQIVRSKISWTSL